MWPSLPVANHIADLANWFFVASLVVGVVSTILIVWMAGVKESYWERDRTESAERVASLTVQGDQLRKDTAEANARAALANEKAEVLRKENIAVWEAVSPRELEFLNTVEELKKFAGTKYLVISFSEYEMRFTAAQIRSVLKHAGWIKIVNPSPELLELPKDSVNGVDIQKSSNMPGERPWDAVTALKGALIRSKISAMGGTSFDVNPALPPNAVRIIVGMKPVYTPSSALPMRPGLTVTGSTDSDDWE